MNQAALDAFLRELFEMAAGLAQPNAFDAHVSSDEFAPDQVIQRDAAGDDVASRSARRKGDGVLALQGFDGFGFNERDFLIRSRARGCGEGSTPDEVAISFQA